MGIKAKFTTNLVDFVAKYNDSAPIELYLFLSMGNNKNGKNLQCNKYLEALIKLINKNIVYEKPKVGASVLISKVKVVLSGEGLYECYVGKERAKIVDEQWRNTQLPFMHDLSPMLKFDSMDIIEWREMTQHPLYQRALSDIYLLYEHDNYLKDIINSTLVPEHIFRYEIDPADKIAAMRAVIDYLFIESAVFLTCGKVICYPAVNFLDVIQYILRKLELQYPQLYRSALYLGYVFKGT